MNNLGCEIFNSEYLTYIAKAMILKLRIAAP